MRPPPLVILMYHAVIKSPLAVPDWCFLNARIFQEQMEAIADTGRVRRLSAAVEQMAKGSVDEPAITVTFDDGFLNNYTTAFPVLKHFDIPATIFINTAFVDTRDCVWFCKVNRAVSEARRPSYTWLGQTYDLSSAEARSATSAEIQARLKEYSHPRLLLELEQLCGDLEQDPAAPVSTDSPFASLDSDSMRRMSASGLVEFGAHTHTHAILSRLSPEQRRFEIQRSIAGVRRLGVDTCDVFAYPNGRRQDYTDDTIDILQSAGIHAAVTAIHGINDESIIPMELRRIGIGPDTSPGEFEQILQHVRA
jgi:peptidoglycan/xylan/chitin deacetylase (PgdA/CDA1 family)